MRNTHKKPKYTWQLLVIISTVLILAINALPTLYGSDNALVISSVKQTQPLPGTRELHDWAAEQKLPLTKIINNDHESKLVFDATDAQLATTEQKLKARLGNDYQVRLGSQSAAPQWLQNLGMAPIKLGLDLSGGVLFVLEVDTVQANLERLQNVKDEARQIIHDQALRGMSTSLEGVDSVTINFSAGQNDAIKGLVTALQPLLPNVQYSPINTHSGKLFFSEQQNSQFHQQIMAQAISTLRGRIEELGITEAVTQREGKNRIRVELPGVKDPELAKRIIGATASLDFYELAHNGTVGAKSFTDQSGRRLRVAPKAIFSGSNIENADAERDEMGIALVNLSLDSLGGKKMSAFSRDNIGNPMVTVFSEYHKNSVNELLKSSKVISVATIQSQLGNRFSITNMANPQAASDLALLLRAGSLDAPITIVQQRTIQASLGQENVNNGIMALVIGVAITLVFMGLWYRKLGMIANISLVLNLVCLLGLMALLPNVVLTLPGIAGLVLTVGMAVDTNVLIFERIKEQRQLGRSNFLAIEAGYRQAFATVLDANITTMITALILLSIGYGPVKGFAMTLSLGILTSMFTGVFVSHVLTQMIKPQIAVKNKEQTL